MTQLISKRTREMSSFIVMDVLEKAHEMERQGIDIIHLEVGEPDFDTPSCIKKAACQALENGHTHYTHSLGLHLLREAICDHYFKTYNVNAKLITKSLIQRLKNKGKKINLFTINDPDEFQHFSELEVDGIFTDFPQRFKKQVK